MTDKQLTLIEGGRELDQYDPEKGLKEIAVSEAAEKHWRRAKDATKLCEAIDKKLEAQADYIVWRDGLPKNKGGRGRKTDFGTENGLPEADPGDLVAHRWRKRLTHKDDEGNTVRDDEKLDRAKADAKQRSVRICEQQKMGTIRGTEGTGEFERYTPAKYIEAARMVLGEIDLDPASSDIAQQTVKATQYFTVADNGLEQEWHGRIWLNPPYHRELAPKFIDKLVAEIAAGHVAEAIMLTNNCTDTDWFLTAAKACSAICFSFGRIRFTDIHGQEVLPTQGQAFFYFGERVEAFRVGFAEIGFGVTPTWW
jgi:hypothetical protein